MSFVNDVDFDMESGIYLDYNASTPCDPEVAEKMAYLFTHEYGNPSSSHKSGIRASAYIEDAREKIAESINALPEEIVFTSGATESNNLAILGVATAAANSKNRRRRIVSLGIEHASVLEPCKELERRGYKYVAASVNSEGTVCLEALPDVFKNDTLLFCIQAANNEIGTIQPLNEVAEIAHEYGALVHCDAAQAIGKIPFDVSTIGVDLVSISSHKCYGPKGVGALWISGGPRRFPISPLFYGGGQERSLRPGTLNTTGIFGFGEAVKIATENLEFHSNRIKGLRDQLETSILASIPNAKFNGAHNNRLPGLTSITIEGIDADTLISQLPNYEISAASACHSGTQEPSHVLRAIGLSQESAYSTFRISIGKNSSRIELEMLVVQIREALERIYQLSI